MKRKPKPRTAPRHSRSTLENLSDNLKGRVKRESDIVRSLMMVTEPKAEMLIGCFSMATVIQVVLRDHLQAMHEIGRVAEMMFPERPVQ